MRSSISKAALGCCLILVLGASAALRADDDTKKEDAKKGVEAKVALEALKALAGEWNFVKGSGPGTEGQKLKYRVVGAGSTVVEEQFVGSDREMVSVYHLDGDDLLMTHYCAMGNQPRLKLDRKGSTATELVFNFDGGTNFDPAKDMHIHEAKILIKGPKNVESFWTGYMEGKPAGEPMAFVLERKQH